MRSWPSRSAPKKKMAAFITILPSGCARIYPASAKIFKAMAVEESEHRHRLLDMYQEKFGDHIPLIRRQDVRGFITPQAGLAAAQAQHRRCAQPGREHGGPKPSASTASPPRRATDVSIRKLLGDLAEAEQEHEQRADALVGGET